MINSTIPDVSPPLLATALLVDLRNFTPNLNAARVDQNGINLFCNFLSEFYALCLNASLIALPPTLREEPPLYVNSTGDGVLVIFSDDSHVRQGFLAAIILHLVLQNKCQSYNSTIGMASCPTTSFGIGVESGPVWRVRAEVLYERCSTTVDTYIGQCINVAARAEAISKLLHNANTIIAKTTNDLLCREIFEQSYNDIVQKALDPTLEDKERLAVHDVMNDLNRRLCVTFIHHHNLKGVEEPMLLFRIADHSINFGNPRFEALVQKLTDGDRSPVRCVEVS